MNAYLSELFLNMGPLLLYTPLSFQNILSSEISHRSAGHDDTVRMQQDTNSE